MHVWLAVACLAACGPWAAGELLTPPYFNLAEGRRITASATCGDGTSSPELYCKLVGATTEENENIINGQACDYCDQTKPNKWHPAENAIDGTTRWWQSPPLSRGSKYNEVTLTIDLGQEFHVAYVFIRMGNSPRPGVWALERSVDNGLTYKPWQYFADTPSDCESYFGVESLQPITRDDSVNCDTQFSKVVPLEGGEMFAFVVKNRPSANDFFNSTVLQEWSRATNIRMRLLRTKTLLGHLMSVVQRQDPTVTRRYYYSIKDISIGGRCVCNGHADTCDITDPNDPYKLRCRCQHNTCGAQCEQCCPGFVQKAWRQSKSNQIFQCEPCNCFGHSDECEYDPEVDKNMESLDIHGRYEGGGVCQNCRDNTEGNNCERCKSRFYRPFSVFLNDTNVCQPCQCDYHYATGNCAEGSGQCECRPEFQEPNCDRCSFGHFGYPDCRPCECHINGTRNGQCEATQGADGVQCPCKRGYTGSFCNQCSEGYYNFPECVDCGCNSVGATSSVCDLSSGQCVCKNNFGGRTCEVCQDGYYQYPDCLYCDCDNKGTEPGICNKEDGQCLCKEGYGGARCDQCVPGYYGYPECRPCGCSGNGSNSDVCDVVSGRCRCKGNFAGRTCDQCSPGYFKYPECFACNCDGSGSIGISCDNDGTCQCHKNFDGLQCERCKEGFYNFPICEECNCDPAGVSEAFQGCGSVPAGELCECKSRVQGRICNECKPLFWNLQTYNSEGCEECSCNEAGTVGGIRVCDTKSGQCMCKPSVTSRKCEECVDGTYDLMESNLFGCTDCGCDIGGSVNSVCNKVTGQCLCQPRVSGRTCDEPLQLHFFPTLYQMQHEAEDGRTPAGTSVRFAYDKNDFQDFSWKGYAVFSQLQNEIVHEVNIQKPSLYRMVLRYVNRNPDAVVGYITIKPDNPGSTDVEQSFKVLFKPTDEPDLVTVADPVRGIPFHLVMNPGHWHVHTKIDKPNVFLDYFVLLPSAFYEANILVSSANKPCLLENQALCTHYKYPSCNRFDVVRGEGGFIDNNGIREQFREYFTDDKRLDQLGLTGDFPLINPDQDEVRLDMRVTKPGPYVILINYFSPNENSEPSTLEVETRSQTGQNKGNVVLYQCSYTTICRQAVTDDDGKVAIFNFDSNAISIVLKGGNNETNVALDSVVAIPLDRWHMDYIMPRAACVRKDGECLQATFPLPPSSKRVEFEQDPERIAKELPSGIVDPDATLVYLDKIIDIAGQVPQEGKYVFIVHFYQPDFPEFEVNGLVHNGQMYEAKLMVPHCPSNSGCRGVIKQIDGSHEFSLTQNFHLTLRELPNKGMWLDYVIVVPAEHYRPNLLHEVPLDRTGVFISQCGKNNFYIDANTTGFCREAVFSLTAEFNNGALPCNCDFSGSTSFECDSFGGQCPCRENVIGRRCEACKTGYYGFPECKPCDCPSTALCDVNTGACICPHNVVGDKCNQCEAYTYGFDPIIGCEECNCNRLGVNRFNLQCDLETGSCDCKENVVGRTCDHCEAGHWYFPDCATCNCDLRGTTPEICDQTTAMCHCKENVQSASCDYCIDGTFNLKASNPAGCSKCFCFGKASRCMSSSLFYSPEMLMDGWTIATVLPDAEVEPIEVSLSYTQYHVLADLSPEHVLNKIAYFVAPEDYLGRKLHSYGGQLKFIIMYNSGIFGAAVHAADVILRGAGIELMHFSIEQPAAAQFWTHSVQLLEENFQLQSGAPATREQLMQVLHSFTGLYIRATYWESTITVRLDNVTMEVGMPPEQAITHEHSALDVEECACPPNYQGLSCEDCAPGYFRAQTGPYGGFCTPCQCNGHADTCDPITGVCINCKHHTTGDHCEMCEVGYHGDATRGDCLICACPLPYTSNNFATGCNVSLDGQWISCQCRPGYAGARCEACASGFYGRPEVEGDYCRPCECSGNINAEDPGSCDSITGKCISCLNNAAGDACAICRPGFFGDAVELKDCQVCDCEESGTEHCDSYTGRCECLPNVEGERCDRCAYDHWNFDSREGCTSCDCGVASLASQCDDKTGQCQCKPGVAGQKCDRCAPGFWDYTPEGCSTCGCNTNFSRGVGCNPKTGQCECLSGVEGEKCDHCPHRWVLIPDQGCFGCDSCIDDLLDVTDELQRAIDPIMDEFDTVALGYFTTQRLIYINEFVDELQPKVITLNPDKVDLTPLQTSVEALEQDHRSVNRRSQYALTNSEKLNGHKLYADALEVDDLIGQAVSHSHIVVMEVDDLAYSLDGGASPQAALQALQEAEAILEEIKAKNLSASRSEAKDVLAKVHDLEDAMQEFELPITNQTAALNDLSEKVAEFVEKLEDLKQHSEETFKKADDQAVLNLAGKSERLAQKVERAVNSTGAAKTALKNAEDLNKETEELLNEAKDNFNKLSETNKNVEMSMLRLDTHFNSTAEGLDDLLAPIEDAQNHAAEISSRAQELDEMLADTRDVSKNAVDAAKAYENIVEAIESSQSIVDEAKIIADDAKEKSAGSAEKAMERKAQSEELLDRAKRAQERVDLELAPSLDQASAAVGDVERINREAARIDERIVQMLESLPTSDASKLAEETRKVIERSESADRSAQQALSSIEDMVTRLPEYLEDAKLIPKNMDDTSKKFEGSTAHIDRVNKVLPNITNLIDSVKVGQENLNRRGEDVGLKIAELKKQVMQARDLANRIKVGVQFYPNTTLQLKNPEGLPLLATSTKISTYLKTSKTNGFVLYLGNAVGTKNLVKRAITDDFLALEIENGYPVLTIDLGSGPQRIVSDKNIADDTWYQIIIDRTGKNAKLTVREEDIDGTEKLYQKEEALTGTYSILNLDQTYSKLFVGGYPSSFEIQGAVKYSSFEGQMEELVIGETPISLWNFADAVNNLPAIERNKLVNLVTSTGLRFDSEGYAEVDAQEYVRPEQTAVSFKFKTYAEEGLVFLLGEDTSYLAVQLRHGRVVTQLNLGDGPKEVESKVKYNDGRWHTVEIARDRKLGNVKINQKTEGVLNTPDAAKESLISEKMYFGGYPGDHSYPELTNIDFDGCIDEVVFDGELVDLTQTKSFGVSPGCPSKVASIVSFNERQPGYVRWLNASSENFLQLTLKLRSSARSGLIFLASSRDQLAFFSLSMVDGKLVLRSQGNELSSDALYNDGEWHVLTATHSASELRLDIDDYDTFTSVQPPSPLYLKWGNMFFAGLPRDYNPNSGTVAASNAFVGCLGDATVNGVFINFANSTDRPGAVLGKCSGTAPAVAGPSAPEEKEEEEGAIDKVRPTPPPATISPEPETTTLPPTTTVAPAPEQCMLPRRPAVDRDVAEDSLRFGQVANGRLEYNSLPGQLKKKFDFTVEFKTFVGDGVIFYVGDENHIDHIALYMKDGKVYYSFNTGSGTLIIQSTGSYRDGVWHTATFSRKASTGKLIIDNADKVEGTSKGTTNSINVVPPYYVGGVGSKNIDAQKNNLGGVTRTFEGCLRNFKMGNDKLVDLSFSAGTSPCSEKVEEGVFFSADGGYIKTPGPFKVGIEIQIKLEIRPRSNNGILMSVHGKGDFFVLQLIDGAVKASVNNGKKTSFSTTYTPPTPYHLCDGKWHTIQVIKARKLVTLTVDNYSADVGVGVGSMTDTIFPLFMGSHRHSVMRGFETSDKQYVGCMRNLIINEKLEKLSNFEAHGNVTRSSCPTN
ncbi:laminin subunit alpha [Cloeon dipterum]|uniref:laminin subunit alpha n=1 Tax=Cloeon dipterum TaxID=197152 RepID=UPI00321FBFB2